MKKHGSTPVEIAVVVAVMLFILAQLPWLTPFWARLLSSGALIVAVIIIAYLVLNRGANVSIFSSARRELGEGWQASSVNIVGGTKFYVSPEMSAEDLDIEFVNLLGSSDLYLPDGWRVEDHSVKLCAGISDKRAAKRSTPSSTITISGVMLLGGVTIRDLPSTAAESAK